MINYIFNFITGLILFFFGINLINHILKSSNRNFLKQLFTTNNYPLINILKGIAITIITQSSSFITVLLTSFVNNDILTIKDASYIIMGSNIGSSLISYIFSLIMINQANFNLKILTGILGIISFLFLINKEKKYTYFLIGIIIILLSINIMGDASFITNNINRFNSFFNYLQNPLCGLIIGIILTVIFQSSSLITLIICKINVFYSIPFLGIINLILGSNIGTCSTAILSSLNTKKEAKKIGLYHLLFNLIGSVIFLIILYIISFLFPSFLLNIKITSQTIAITSVIFNLFATIIILPINKILIKLCNHIIK